jgi:hypothetical protein
MTEKIAVPFLISTVNVAGLSVLKAGEMNV